MTRSVGGWGEKHAHVLGCVRSRIVTGHATWAMSFDSFDAAMKNSEDPLTTEFAEKVAELTDGPPVFRNLDVVRTEGFGGPTS